MANGDGTQTAQATPALPPPPQVPDHLSDLRISPLAPESTLQTLKRNVTPEIDTSRSALGPGHEFDNSSPQQEGEQQYKEMFGSPLERAYGHLKSIVSRHEGQVSEKYLKPFRESLDRMGQDLVAAGESGHTRTGGQLTTPARLMTLGVGHLLGMVPVGHDVQSTIAANVVPPEFGPEGKALSKELKAAEKSAAVTETGWLTKNGKFEPLKTGEGHYDAANRLGLDVKDTKGAQPTYDAINAGHIRVYRHQKANASHFEAEAINDQSKGLISKALNDSSFPEGHSVQLEFHKPKYTLKEFDSPDQAKEWLENLGTRTEQQQLPPQPRLPDTGTHAAIKTDDGSIYYDDAPEKQRTHIMLAKDLGIPPERVVSGGWLKDGEYEGSERSDAGRWGEQARAKAAVAEKRSARAAQNLPAPTTPTPEAKARERAANLKGLGIGLTEMAPEDAKNWVGYTNQKSLKVYRGVDDPAHSIEAGDFVTTSKESAQNYGRHVQEMEVSPSELRYVRGHKDGDPKLLDKGGQTELIYTGAGKAQATATDDQILSHFDKKYSAAQETVDGRAVREHVPNYDSISASLAPNYEVLDGVREVPMSHFDDPGSVTPRTKQLAADIKQSGELNPLIVAIDHRGPYILEGGHRFDALRINKAKSFPAVVALDLNRGFRPEIEGELGKELAAKAGQTETLYHGSPDVSKIEQLKPGRKGGYFGDGIYLTRDPNVARRFTKLEAMNPTLERNADGSFTDINTGKRIPGGKPGVLETTLKDARLKKITMDEMDAEIEKFRKPNGVIDLDGARNAIAQKYAKQGYDGFDVAKSKYFDEPQVVIFPSSANKLSINRPEAKALHTIEGAAINEAATRKLGKGEVDTIKPMTASKPSNAEAVARNRPKIAEDNLRRAQEWGIETRGGNLVLYHGTRSGQAIRNSGKLTQGSYLAADEKTARQYAEGAAGKGKAEVLPVEVPAGTVLGNGDYFSANEDIPYKPAKQGMIVYRNGRKINVEPPKKLK